METPSPAAIRDALHRNDNDSMHFVFEAHARHCLDFLTAETDCTPHQAEGLFIDAVLMLREQILREEVSTFVALREQLLHILLSLYNRHLNEEGYHQDVSQDLLDTLREKHPTLTWASLDNKEKQALQIQALEAFNDLQEQHRLVLHYYYVRHWTLREICDTLEIPSEEAANQVKADSYLHWLHATTDPEGKDRHYIELVLSFIDGRQNTRQQEAFEQQLVQEDFQQQIQIQLAMIEAIRGVDRAAAADDFYGILDELIRPGISPEDQRKRQRLLVAAAAIIVVGLIAWWQWPQPDNRLFVPYPGPAETQVAGEEQLQASFTYYNEGRYEEALRGLTEIAIQDPNANELELMVGSCYLATDKAILAIPWFRQMDRAKDPQLREDGAWYLGLAYREAGMTTKSQQVMRQLADSSSTYHDAALGLLQEWQMQ